MSAMEMQSAPCSMSARKRRSLLRSVSLACASSPSAQLDALFELPLGFAQSLGGGTGIGDVARGGIHEVAGRLRTPGQHAIAAVLVADRDSNLIDALAAIDLRVHDAGAGASSG